MAKHLTLSEAQQQFLQLPDELIEEPIIITKEGQPVMAALSYDHLMALVETLDILSDASFTEKLRESIQQAEQGETLSWDAAKAQIEQ